MKGESLSLDTVTGSSSVEWVAGSLLAQKQPLTWYKVIGPVNFSMNFNWRLT